MVPPARMTDMVLPGRMIKMAVTGKIKWSYPLKAG